MGWNTHPEPEVFSMGKHLTNGVWLNSGQQSLILDPPRGPVLIGMLLWALYISETLFTKGDHLWKWIHHKNQIFPPGLLESQEFSSPGGSMLGIVNQKIFLGIWGMGLKSVSGLWLQKQSWGWNLSPALQWLCDTGKVPSLWFYFLPL